MKKLSVQEQRFVSSGGVIPNEAPEKTDTTPSHYELVLCNTNRYTWTSADQRVTSISKMADQHLVNTMRWLIKNATQLKQAYLQNVMKAHDNLVKNNYPATLQTVAKVHYEQTYNLRNSAGILTAIVAPFQELAEECVRRFGPRALQALYDGQ